MKKHPDFSAKISLMRKKSEIEKKVQLEALTPEIY